MKIKSGMALLFLTAISYVASAQTLDDAKKAYNAGVTANGEGNITEAITQFEACITACEYLVKEEESEEAETMLTSVQGVVPKLYLQLGKEQLKNNLAQEALANIYKAKETATNYGDKETLEKANTLLPQILHKIAVSKYKSEDLAGALIDIDKAIAIDPDFSVAYHFKAVVLKKQDNDAALKETVILGIAACKHTKDTATEKKIVDLGFKYYLKKGNDAKAATKYKEAEGFLLSALEFNATEATALYLLASTYSAQSKLDLTIETANKAIANEAGGAEAQAKIYLLVAEAQAKKGNNPAACEAYKKAAVGQYAEHANYQVQHVLKCE